MNVAVDTPSLPVAASPAERIDFLKYTLAFTEHNVRAYDTKAQISMAAFLFSMNPLWSILSTLCPHMASTVGTALLVLTFMATILLYCFVLLPVRLNDKMVTEGLQAQGLFFIANPFAFGNAEYLKKLQTLSVESELSAELIKLSQIRARKQFRFKISLIATVAFYLLVAVVYLNLRLVCK